MRMFTRKWLLQFLKSFLIGFLWIGAGFLLIASIMTKSDFSPITIKISLGAVLCTGCFISSLSFAKHSKRKGIASGSIMTFFILLFFLIVSGCFVSFCFDYTVIPALGVSFLSGTAGGITGGNLK